jgi:hypothetical protein
MFFIEKEKQKVMADTVFDIRKYLDDKRIYKSLKGHELNFSFRPTAIDEMFKKYSMLELEVAKESVGFNKMYLEYVEKIKKNKVDEALNKKIEKETSRLQKIASKAREIVISIILLSAKSNGQDEITEKWISEELDPREFGFILRFITGTEETLEVKKK